MKKIIKKRKRRLPDLWLPEILAVAFVLFLAHMTINHFTQEEHPIVPQNTERHEGIQKGNQSPQSSGEKVESQKASPPPPILKTFFA